jgi:protein ImuB
MSAPVRTLVVVVPDWPVVAAFGAGGSAEPTAVLHANRVVACSPAARADGVLVGQRRREAQARCPALAVADHDVGRAARAFEPVVAALDVLTPRIELTVPGRCAFPTRGPSRYFGGDDALARQARALAGAVAPGVCVGIADGPFAAGLAADRDVVVPIGGSPSFVAPWPLDALGLACTDLVDVWRRLGLRTLGDLAALPAADVLARFGGPGIEAHRLARGLDARPPATRPPPPELTVEIELDPPAERVETAAFVARGLADDLHGRLSSRGLACTRVAVVAETEHGERLERLWRHEGTLSAGAIADRVRWQLDGWLTGSALHRPTAGISLLRLVPDEVVPARGRQLGFWGGAAGADDRALRALARLEGLLGADAVTVPEWRGGRGPHERVALVPAAAADLDAARPAASPASVVEPWPGHVPDPAPATVLPRPMPAEVVDHRGRPVAVTGRGAATGDPVRVRIGDGPTLAVEAWAGPWPADERWWDPGGHRRRARFQVVTDDGCARLLSVEGGRWWIEAVYD